MSFLVCVSLPTTTPLTVRNKNNACAIQTAHQKQLNVKIILYWRAYAHKKQERTKLYHVARAIYARALKTRVMNAWVSEHTGVSRDKMMKGSQEMLKKTAEEIVKRYEGRIATVRHVIVGCPFHCRCNYHHATPYVDPFQLEAQLGSAQQEVLDGHRRRQHLEDELRRTLLKGINAMNLEALNIFNSAASTDTAKSASFLGGKLLLSLPLIERVLGSSLTVTPLLGTRLLR